MRQFVAEKFPDKAGLLDITGKDFKYFRQVLRVRSGDMISLRLPDGELKNSTVALVDDKQKKITLQLCDTVQVSKENLPDSTGLLKAEFWLLQFVPKPQKFELIVRQATECGIKHIIPVIGEYSEKSGIAALQGGKKERLERIIKEARQQSGSPVDTVLYEPMPLEKAVEMVGESGGREEAPLAFVLSERKDGDKAISEIVAENPDKTKFAIAVGSEGGISPAEIEFLQNNAHFYPIHFSVNILRCETAALYGIAAVQTAVIK